MIVEIIIRDDKDEIVAHHKALASHPTEQKRQQPLMDGKYEIWGFTFAPHIRIRENWVALRDAGVITLPDPSEPEPQRVLFSK